MLKIYFFGFIRKNDSGLLIVFLFLFAGLLKLTAVYASKKIATVEDLPENARVNENERNIYQIWRIVLGKIF